MNKNVRIAYNAILLLAEATNNDPIDIIDWNTGVMFGEEFAGEMKEMHENNYIH